MIHLITKLCRFALRARCFYTRVCRVFSFFRRRRPYARLYVHMHMLHRLRM